MARSFSIAAGVVLLGLGLWGMFTGGDPHEISIFEVNALHNVLHIVTGAFAIIAGLSGGRAPAILCLVLGAIYGLASVLGFFGVAPLVNALTLNAADNWFHLAIGGACLWMGGSEPRVSAAITS
jgi:hypothetical protein